MKAILKEKFDLVHKLAECILTCNYCMNACLDEEHVMMMKDCIRLDSQCSVICSTTLQLLHKHSRFMQEELELCAKACEACAEECSKHQQDHCQLCAQACKECAQACRNFMSHI